jgi:Activator of Hsp90 ATPase homolog 1-like protein
MTSSERPEARILGSLRSAGGAGIVRIEDRYDTGIDDLWSALTDPRRLAGWYGEVTGDLRPGGEFRLFEATLTADGDRAILVIEVRGVPLDNVELAAGIG